MPSFRFPSPSSIRRRLPRPPASLTRSSPLSTTSTTTSPSTSANSTSSLPTTKYWPSPYIILLGGPRLLLRAPGAALRVPGRVGARTSRLFSAGRLRRQQQQQQQQSQQQNLNSNHAANASTGNGKGKGVGGQEEGSFTERLKKRLEDSPTKWYPIPLSLGVAVLVMVNFYKQRSWEGNSGFSNNNGASGSNGPVSESEIKVKGPWQVHVLGALPLRSMSRIYGTLNAYTLPVWFRVPGYKFYSFIFGVNLDECEPSDLREYRSMSEFFMRKLKAGVRPIADAQLVSPADGRVVNFGTVEGGRVEQVKGSTYSLEALLAGTGQMKNPPPPPSSNYPPHPQNTDHATVDEAEFANVNGITYSLDALIGSDSNKGNVDASLSEKEASEQKDGPERGLIKDAKVALELNGNSIMPWSGGHVAREGNKLFFAVVYLAPGDYHRFHSPTSWVVERRRHFAGELFSVSPWMANKLQDLFVLNERVALLGRWRHGFFSMVPVGATNVGSIRVNFDSTLRTNSPLRPITPGTFSEAVYTKASNLLHGQPLNAGDEIGGFWLGSTIVLVFEAPESFEFSCHKGDLVKVGEKLGDIVKK